MLALLLEADLPVGPVVTAAAEQGDRVIVVSRRGFLKAAALSATAISAPALQGLGLLAQNGRAAAAPGDGGYGKLIPTRDHRDGVERLALPEGFQYCSFGVSGQQTSRDGVTPYALDGMGVFNVNGKFRLVRNHEDRNGAMSSNKSVKGNEAPRYDSRAGGGTTTLVVNPFTRELEEDWVSLNGTIVNCGGGQTPWGTWITCEETNAGTRSGWRKQHGYCFEVTAAADATVPAIPIPDMGRFAHEAVAVDPETGYIYETEDNGASKSGFYRFIPRTPGRLADGGKLQMIGIQGRSKYNTYIRHARGTQLPVIWHDIAKPNPSDPSSSAVFKQGRAKGGAAFARLEGCWWGDGAVYFASTNGGGAEMGQIWEYRPSGLDTGSLTLIFESPGARVLKLPDHLTATPQGGLLLCEDTGGARQYLRGLTKQGKIFDFACNLEDSFEWAGACFAEADPGWDSRASQANEPPADNGAESPSLGERWDRITLFVNRQGGTSGSFPPSRSDVGMTFAIWGPWNDGAL
jgi:uncharacterized protein